MDVAKLQAFEREVGAAIPGFQIRFKNESPLMKVLGFFAYPFNRTFMESYTTTLAPKVWFPSREFYEAQPASSFSILAHEYVHLTDSKKSYWTYTLGTIFPQVLALIPLVLYGVFGGWRASVLLAAFLFGFVMSLTVARTSMSAFWVLLGTTALAVGTGAVLITGWWSLLLLAAIVLFLPWPSPGRVHWELRGYSVQLALRQWHYGSVPDTYVDGILSNFTGSNYYFMSWAPAATRQRLLDIVARAKSGELQKETPYDLVYRCASEYGLIPPQGN
jgi:hypothetical protein